MAGTQKVNVASAAAPMKVGTMGMDVCQEEEARLAAMEGFFVPDDEVATEEKDTSEPTVLFGDNEKLTVKQIEVVLNLKESMIYSRIKLKQIALSFSGASVYFYSPIRRDGTPMPSSVLKLDTEANIRDEVKRTNEYAPLFGLTTPKVKDVQSLPDAGVDEPCAVMQIDLCGGVFGLPEFASAPPVHTFAAVIQTEMDTTERQVDVVPLVNEALERRLHSFTMSGRSVQNVNLAKMYKLVRFVGHGVLNRAKEAEKRAKKSPALAAGFLNPLDIDELDPEGSFLQELTGSRKTVKEFFQEFVSFESQMESKFVQRVVCGLCHNDMHGGNLLLDSQGLVWLIDFATVKDDMHVLMDLAKFMASCLFLYLGQNVDETHIHTFAKLLVTTPDATTALPLIGSDELKKDATAGFVLDLLSRLRHCMCVYEIGDDAPTNDGTPFALAFFSWSARMLSYNEPSRFQKTRALYCALAGAQRVLSELNVEIGPVASEWIDQYRQVWEGQKGRRLSTSAVQIQVVPYHFELEFPRFLAQVGTSESWTTDFLTRERLHVTDHAISVDVAFSAKIHPRYIRMSTLTKLLVQSLHSIFHDFLPDVLKLERYFGRLLVIGDSGSGKTMLTRQLFSEAAQRQLVNLYDPNRVAEKSHGGNRVSLIPVRIPLIDLARHLEVEPDACLEADPVNDLLTGWVQRKYGQDSIPYKLTSDARQSGLQKLARRGSVCSVSSQESCSVGELNLARRGSVDSAGSLQSCSVLGNEDVSGLFLLLDALDEASSYKSAILEYLESLLTSEPTHVTLITSRPGSVGQDMSAKLADLGFNSFSMSALSVEQARKIVNLTLHRAGDSQQSIDAVVQDLLQPGYKVLRENPLILTLLTHVLRKHHRLNVERVAAGGPETSAELKSQELMKKTEVYQRAVRLMLHQSDAAKFALRDGKNDKAIVHRLEMLKSARARKLFQSIAWHGHTHKDRAMSWQTMSEATSDPEMLQAFKAAFEDGRMPIFEPLPVAGGEPLVQMVHMSFQELMVGEYTSAIVRHAHSTQKTRSYINYFLSSSGNGLERDRLSELWWVQVWFHLCEMLSDNTFQEWCNILAEDQRVQMKVGSIGYFHAQGARMLTNRKKMHATRFWHAGHKTAVQSIDWEKNTVRLKEVVGSCEPRYLLGIGRWTWNFSNVIWPADGVALVFRQAIRVPYMDVIQNLLQRHVHYGCVDELALHPLLVAYQCKQHAVTKLMFDMKADTSTFAFTCIPNFHLSQLEWESEIYLLKAAYPSGSELRYTRLPPMLEQAKAGSLPLGADVDPNYADPTSLMTPLMCAAAGGQTQLVGELLQKKASVDAQSFCECTALTFAMEQGQGNAGLDCAKLLINARADVNHRAMWKNPTDRFCFNDLGRGQPMALHLVATENFEKLDTLLHAGYKADLPTSNGYTAMMWAGKAGSLPMIKKLLDAKADPLKLNLKQDKKCNMPLFAALIAESGFTRYSNAAGALKSCADANKLKDVLNFQFDTKMDPKMCIGAMHYPFTVSLVLWSLWWSYPVSANADMSVQQLLLDRKAEVEVYAGSSFTMTHLMPFMVFTPTAVQWWLDNKADVNRKSWFTGNFYDTAVMFKNRVCIDTYNDWLLMQSVGDEEKQFAGFEVPKK